MENNSFDYGTKQKKSKKEVSVLITAGPTKEPIDAVRHISNFSTGRLGVCIAKEAYLRGYKIELLCGEDVKDIPENIKTNKFVTTNDLLDKVLTRIKDVDIFICSAAISDYTPEYQDKKIDSNLDELFIKLKPTPKVIKEAKKISNPKTIFIAFKLGYNLTEKELIDKAMESYGDLADIIIVNDLKKIEKKEHPGIILSKGKVLDTARSKEEIAEKLFDVLDRYFI